eukprot:jgi/Mesen1/2515/ME000016S01862
MGDSGDNVLAVAWHKYLRQLRQRPLETKAITSGVLAGVSDILAQKLAGGKELQMRRTVLMALFGAVYGGPSAHFVHRLLDRLFAPKGDFLSVAKKVVVEQLTYGPLCNILLMAYISLVVEGRSWHLTRRKLEKDYASVQLNGWKVWPLAALINYRYVPIQFRVLFVNIVGIFWSTFLILRARTAAPRLIKIA